MSIDLATYDKTGVTKVTSLKQEVSVFNFTIRFYFVIFYKTYDFLDKNRESRWR